MLADISTIDDFLHQRSAQLLDNTFCVLSDEELRARGLRYGVRIQGPVKGYFLETNIRPGFIITTLDNEPLVTLGQLKQALENRRGVMLSGIFEDGTHDHFFLPTR